MSIVLPFVSPPPRSPVASRRRSPSDRAVLRQLVADLEILVVEYPSAVTVLAEAAQRFVAPLRTRARPTSVTRSRRARR